MIIQINHELSVETEILFQTVLDFYMVWETNAHAELYITGILEQDKAVDQLVYDRTVKLILNQEILFAGIILEVQKTQRGITTVTIKAASASIRMDVEERCSAYQNVRQSYSEIAELQVESFGGSVICTVGEQKIGKPLICYRETAWSFIKRLASRQNALIIADVFSGEPNIWYGMKMGDIIRDELMKEKVSVEVKKSYCKSGTVKCVKTYQVECGNNYSLGDRVELFGETCVINKKELWFEKGDLRFLYCLSEPLETETMYNDIFTGLSLTGTVYDLQGESICLSFDIRDVDGEYYYPWRPETGNTLYEMPEKSVKIMVYFRDHDEQNGVAVRCMTQSTQDWQPQDKVNQILEDVYVGLRSGEIGVKKSGEQFRVGDSKIDIQGSSVSVVGSGKIRIEAKQLLLTSPVEIKIISDK